MDIVDTHCHIHEIVGTDDIARRWREAGKTDADAVIADARTAAVTRLICVGCTVADSQLAVEFVQNRKNTWASIGIHPHEAKNFLASSTQEEFTNLATQPKVIAIGECGLDYFYNHSPREAQEQVLRFQIELALKHNLPLIFHVRDAFEDFWPIFDEYKGVRGVIHSFTADEKVLDQILLRGLYVGLNGIMTFTKNEAQLTAAKKVSLDRLLLETDAPFLTPVPYRGTICESKHVRVTAEFLAKLRGEAVEQVAMMTTQNACQLFALDT